MRKKLTVQERLAVAADFKPPEGLTGSGKLGVRMKVLNLARALADTGVYIKVNSALRVCGYELIDELHSHGLRVFADLKLCDIPETLSTDGDFLRQYGPELVTVMCSAGTLAMQRLVTGLPESEVLAVTALTSFTDGESAAIYGTKTVLESVGNLSYVALRAGVGGVVCSAMEASLIRQVFGEHLTINTPAIRPTWAIVPGDDQNPQRIMTPALAIQAGADRIIVGRPITTSANPREAVERTLQEIASSV